NCVTTAKIPWHPVSASTRQTTEYTAWRRQQTRPTSGPDWHDHLRAKCIEDVTTFDALLTNSIQVLRGAEKRVTIPELGRALDIAIPGELSGRVSCAQALSILLALMTRQIDPMNAEDAAVGVRGVVELVLPSNP